MILPSPSPISYSLIISSNSSITPSTSPPLPSNPNPFSHQTSSHLVSLPPSHLPPLSLILNVCVCGNHNFAFSPTVPTFNLSEYFFNTLSLWYFQNCFVASFPATRLRIFDPPGCSSMKPVFFLSTCANFLCVGRGRVGKTYQ